MSSTDNEHTDPRPTAEIISAALATEDDEEYWDLVLVLKHRGTREVFEAARELTESDDPDRRVLGVDILSEIGLPGRVFLSDTIELLVAMLEHETDEDVMQMICYAFGRNPEAGVVEPLVKLKDHPSARVRDALVFGLLGQENDLAAEALIELSGDPDDEVRNWATFGLGQQIDIDPPGIREALIRRLDDPFDAVRGEALRGLAKRGDERVIESLIRELGIIAEADEWWDYAFEAAENLPDPRLHPALMAAKESGIEGSTLDRAIALCRTPAAEEANDRPSDAPTTCPVCGRRRAFKKIDSLQFCRRCGWFDDPDQRANPDSVDGYNRRSLNQERERWLERTKAAEGSA